MTAVIPVEISFMRNINIASHVLMGVLIVAALSLHLVPEAFAGLLVYTLTQKISSGVLSRVHPRLTTHARAIALAFVILAVFALFAGVGAASVHFIKSKEGLPWLFANMADILDKLRISLPPSIQEYVPANVDEVKSAVVDLLRSHSEKLSDIGVETLKSGALVLLALVAGAMVSWTRFDAPEAYKPLAQSMLYRLTTLVDAFGKVVFAQVKISLLNTTLTAVYLLVVLPQLGVQLPLAKTLVAVTFFAGLLPVIGNIISNSIIVTLSLGVSPQIALASLGFLILVHKLEYFLNAKIIGSNIEAAAWELILSMIVMERLFGVSGLVAAPVLYAYVKNELRHAGLIGRLWPYGAVPLAQTESAQVAEAFAEHIEPAEQVSSSQEHHEPGFAEESVSDAAEELSVQAEEPHAVEEPVGGPAEASDVFAPAPDTIIVTSTGEALTPDAIAVEPEDPAELVTETVEEAAEVAPPPARRHPWENRRR